MKSLTNQRITQGLTTAALLAAGALAGSASAASVGVHFDGYLGGTFDARIGSSNYAGGAGLMQWTLTSESDPTSLPADVGDQFFTFCIEFLENVTTNHTYEVVQPQVAPLKNGGLDLDGDTNTVGMGAAKAELLTYWFGAYYDSVVTAGDITIGSINTSQQERAMAFQMGVWEIVYENLDDIGNSFSLSDSTNNFFGVDARSKTDPDTLVQAWMTSDADSNSTADWRESTPILNLVALRSGTTSSSGKQDQVTLGPALPPPPPVPSPTTLGLGGIALVGLVARRRRKA